MNIDSTERRADAASIPFMMGEIRSDVKHILAALHQVSSDQQQLSARLDVVEKFNTRILGMATVAIPAVSFAATWLMQKFGI